MKRYGLLIDNELREPEGGRYFISSDPSNGEPIAEFAQAGPGDVRAACAAARAAFESGWGRMDPDDRAELMHRAAAGMRRRQQELAELESRDTGKPIRESAGFDIPFSILAFDYFADLGREILGHVIPVKNELKKEYFDFVTYEPYGVVAVISPYNFPLHLLTRSLCPALAAGNTAVLKASSMTPATTALLGEILVDAGFPPGVINVVSGAGATVGESLASDRDVDVIAFTGSEAVGRRLMELSARSPIIKKTVLELGGKGPYIVEPDCDLDEAAAAAVTGLAFNQGEVCCAMTRLILHESIYEDFLTRLASRLDALVIGPPLDPATQIGSLVNAAQLERVDAYVRAAIGRGARLVCGGERYAVPPCDKGSFYRPTVLDRLAEVEPCWREEIFGPVLVAKPYRELKEAVAMANDSDFGLGANLFTRDYRRAYWASKRLNAGSVWVNVNNGAQMNAPFGGNKNSGMGREYGVFGLHEYLRAKNNCWNVGIDPLAAPGARD